MIKQILGSIILYRNHITFINNLGTLSGTMWDEIPANSGLQKKDLDNLKNHIYEALINLQGPKCAYCGLDLFETSAPEIEHIAPKGMLRNGTVLNPQFMFTPNNLVLACRYCNSFSKKGTINTITKLDFVYENCEFNIVHPYFDDPRSHFSWQASGNHILITGLTPKGLESIRIFKLDGTEQTIARAKIVARDSYQISQNDLERFQAAINYRL